MSFPNTPSQKFRAALASQTASLALLDRLFLKLQATQPNFDPLYSLRNTDPSTRQTSLHIAANAGRLNVVEWLLEQGVEAEISRDSAGETVLHVAAAKGFVEILVVYLERFRFVVDWVNSRGMTPLHTAAMRGELESAQILIDSGADINAPDLFGNTPLHYALSWGKLTVVKLLVELDCETDLKNNQGFSASDFAYSFAAVDALKVYIRIHHDALKSARASKSRRPRNPRIDSGASSSSRNGSKPFRTGSSSELSTSAPPLSPPADELVSPPLQPVDSPYAQSAASPSLSDTSSPLPGRFGLGVRLPQNGGGSAGRDSPLPAPIAVRPTPISPSLISLQPATPTTPQTPRSPSFSQHNTTSPARSPIQDPSSPIPAPATPPSTTSPQLRALSPLSLQRAIRETSRTSPIATPPSESSYFPPALASTSTLGSVDASTLTSGSPATTRPPAVPLELARSSSSSSDLVLVPTGPKKLRKKGGRRESIVQEQQQRPSSVPAGSTILGGGPGGKKLRSERSMSFGTAMTGTGDVPNLRPVMGLGDGGRSRSSTTQSMGSFSSSSGSEMPPLQPPPPIPRTSHNDHYSDMIPSSPPLGPVVSSPSPSPPQDQLGPLPSSSLRLGPIPPAIPPVDSAEALTTRSLEPSFIVVSGSSTRTSPNPPSTSTFPPPASAEPRLSGTSSRNSISLGRPSSSPVPHHTEVAKLRKSSAQAKARERSASEASKESKAGGNGSGRLSRVFGFGRKPT